MYSIANIIYGIPLVSNEEVDPHSHSAELSEAILEEEDGFLSYYSGTSDNSPTAFGVEIGEFDECNSFVNMSDIPSAPSKEQLKTFSHLWATLSPTMQSEITKNYGAPRVFLLWSTS